MAEGADPSNSLVPETPQNEASISDTISELLRHPQLGSLDPSLSFLDDPTALLESALSTDSSLLMGTVAGSVDTSALLDAASNSAAGVTSGAGALPVSQPRLLNPPLAVPDISHLTSMAAASGAEMSTAQQLSSSSVGSLNPPLSVPDISHLTASLGPLAVPQDQFSTLQGTQSSTSPASGKTQLVSGAMESAPEVIGPEDPLPATVSDADQIKEGQEQHESATTSAGGVRIPDTTEFAPASSIAAAIASDALEPVLEAPPPQLAGATTPVSRAVMAPTLPLLPTDLVPPSSSSLAHSSIPSSGIQAGVQTTGTQAPVEPLSKHASVQAASDSEAASAIQPVPSSQSAPPPVPMTSTGTNTALSQALTGATPLLTAPPTSTPPLPLLPVPASSVVRPPITPKGLNLPLLQFLQLNFPNLRIDNLKDILQVNSLLSHALQHQQQQIAAATSATATPIFTSASALTAVGTAAVGTAAPVSVAKPAAKATDIIKAKLASVPVGSVRPAVPAGQFIPIEKVAKSATSSISVASQISVTKSLTSVGTSTNSSSRAPVFVQIIRPGSSTSTSTGTQATPPAVTRPQPKAKPVVIPRSGGSRLPLLSSTSSTPNILARQPRLPGLVVQTTLASVPSTIPTASPIGVGVAPARKEAPLRVSTRPSRKPRYLELSKTHAELSRTVIKPAESEPMDVDVGQPVQRLEYPAHLRDHTYCIYNPAEGENIARIIAQNFHVACTIPPARLSYAPQIPDSPTTLHKLLKVVPRKSAARNSAASTPRGGSRSSTPRARYSSRSKGNRARPAGKASARKSDSRPESEESHSHSSSSGGSEGEDDSVQRRRSQRNMGQRKRYVDDLNLALSDEEVLGEVMISPTKNKKYYKGYGEEEEREWYDEDGSNGRTGKHKSRTISVNPTEGFQYSDVYFEPPPEEAHLVERILAYRQKVEEGSEEKIEEYFVKYKNYSYLHTEWASFKKLLAGDKRFDGKVKRFKQKQESLGIFANVDDEPFNPEYTVVDRILDVASQKEPNGEIITHYLVKWRSLPYEDATWELEEDVDPEKIRQFNLMQMIPPSDELAFVPRPRPSAFKPIKESPQYNEGCQLRPYQLEGLNWLLFNWYTRQNCILADEMGLGKTVQSIALIMAVFNAGIRGPFLVIAPLSTIANWQREFESWCDLNVVIYHGSAYSRRLIHEYELYYRDVHGRIIPDHFKFNVIVTTYEVMLSDDSELQNVEWRLVIIDEAHRLKNRNCKLLEGLRTLDMEHRVLLTGTPLQNSVDELFSLLNFLEPSTFPSHLAFLQQFGDLRTEEQVEELKMILKPMMLRRLKEDVEKSIAPKEETIVEVELTVIQKQYYRAILERNFTFLSTKGAAATIPSLLNVMMELRKCCNHPFLIKGAEPKIVQDFQAQHPEQPVYNALVQASGKLVLIDKLLPKLKENGHKVLIFSQMVRCLDILEDYLRIKGYFYERIDGQVRGILRQAAIDRFSKPDSDRFVFLLCTRAGGLGINLTAADTVIIYDSDWNPQNDIQAQARCHRIGQNKSVKVYRLITRNSYEREMFDRASLKLGLDKAVLQAFQSNPQSTGSGPPQLSKREIEDLLRKGAYGAIMEEDDDANKFCEEDIDQILERRAHVIQLESEANSTFAKASFVADGSSDLSIDDPDFWQKWAERAKLDLEQLANKDSLVIDTPRQRRQVRRYGNESLEEIVDMTETIEEVMDILPSRGRWGWTRLECFKVEKWLLTFGWGQWKDIVRAASFKKRALGVKDVENISRTMLVYCLAHFKGDEKVPPYIHRLIDPSERTEPTQETGNSRDGFFGFTEDDYLALLTKNPETLFQDDSYMKHLRRHATKILLRMRQLHITRWSMLAPFLPKIMKGVPAKSLGLVLPRPEEPPPTAWWNTECDHSLLVGIVKHGYERFGLMRSDPALCFRALVGEEPVVPKKSKKGKTPVKGEEADEEEEEEELSGMESEGEGDGESGPSTPSATSFGRKTRSYGINTSLKPGQYRWPSLADVNTRARRMVSAWLKQQRKEELKVTQQQKEREKKEREAEASRKKEQKRAELAQKWSKREKQDFARVISFFGVVFNAKTNRYLWTKFRQLANLSKKSDERLTLYLHDFKQMCWRVLKKKRIRRGLSGMRVEPITEERASRCLQRIDLLSAVREEILPHPDFDQLIRLCELSFEVPTWWIPVDHDRDLLRGVAKHGLYRSDQLIYNDPELSFKETVPQTALFDPNTNQAVEEEEEEESGSGSDGEPGEHKLRSSGPTASNPVPLGWPKEKAIVIRMTRIVYAFRHGKWPKPMEGLDLFTPVVTPDSSSESSDSDWLGSEGGSDSDYEAYASGKRSEKTSKGLKVYISTRGATERSGSPVVDVEGDVSEKDFEIEKHHGLKLTLKKSSHQSTKGSKQEEALKLEIKIPLVQLQFASKAGLKRIPKKRPADTRGDSPDAKRHKKQGSPSTSSSSKAIVIVDPAKINFTELSGRERVGVINRNTKERLSLKQSPTLKTLQLWLQGHPHYNVDPIWGQLVLEWGALKPDLYSRILPAEGSLDVPSVPEYEPVSD